MQGRGQNTGEAALDQEQQMMLRLKRFALALTGDDIVADDLVVALAWENVAADGKALSSGASAYVHFKRLFDIWEGESKHKPVEATLFQAGNESEAVRKGLDPSIAVVLGSLPSLHRAALLLIYGEDFSYVATARLLNISIEQLMTVLAQARIKFNDPVTGVTQ